MPATARTLVAGSAHSATVVADGDGDAVADALVVDDGDVEDDADADADADGLAEGDADGLAEGDAVSLALELGDADAGVLSFTDDPAGTGVAGADDALESAGDDGTPGDGSAVTSALELGSNSNGESEPTRGPLAGSAVTVDNGSGLSEAGADDVVADGSTRVDEVDVDGVGSAVDVALNVTLGVALADGEASTFTSHTGGSIAAPLTGVELFDSRTSAVLAD